MTTPVALPQFTVQQYIEEAKSPDVAVSGDAVNVQPLPIVVTFTPSVSHAEVGSTTPPFTVYFDPIQGRVDTDGWLKGMNDQPAYYLDGTTVNPVPANANPVYTTSHEPDHWVDALAEFPVRRFGYGSDAQPVNGTETATVGKEFRAMPGIIDFDRLRRKALEDQGLTPQQRKWKRLKAMQLPLRMRGPIGHRRKIPCTCVHTPKHHKKSGRCRGNCKCQAGIRA
jgi:hypothetical protein